MLVCEGISEIDALNHGPPAKPVKVNAMPIYQRTTEGQWAAYNVDSPLPRKLKILLKSIDGRVSDEVYAVNLKSFGNVQQILLSLLEAGLIEDARSGHHRKPASSKTSETDHKPSAAAKPKPVAKVLHLVDAKPSGPAQSHPQGDMSLNEWALKVASETMSNFVLAHLPNNAFRVLPEIDALKSIDQLLVLMDGYAQFVQKAGPLGATHLADIKALIEMTQTQVAPNEREARA
jgi:hypothetical protein